MTASTATATATTAAVVTGSLLVAASLYMGLTKGDSSTKTSSASASASSKAKNLEDIDDMEGNTTDDEDHITSEEVTKIFDRLFMEMQGMFGQLMQQIQQIQMAGQQIPEAQIQAILKSELGRGLAARQKVVLEEYDMDEECLEEATWEFLQDATKYPAVQRSVDRFQKFWESTTGQPVTGWRKGQSPEDSAKAAAAAASVSAASEKTVVEPLSPQRTIEVAEKYFNGLTGAMRTLIAEYKADGKNLQEASVQNALNLDFANRANPAGEAALEAEGTTQAHFEASVKAHGNNKSVAQALAMMQMKQQQELSGMATS